MSALQPTLGERIAGPEGAFCYRRRVDVHSDPYVLDHVVQGMPVLPAAYLVGLMTQAAECSVPNSVAIGGRNIRFEQAARLGANRTLQFAVTAAPRHTGEVAVDISSQMDPPRAGFPPIQRRHSRGEIWVGAKPPSPPAFKPLAPEKAEDYDYLYRLPREIQHGPLFRAGIAYCRLAPLLLFALVAPPAPLSGWRADPAARGWPCSLLNAILHVGFSLAVLQTDATVLPVELEEAELFHVPAGEVQVVARMQSAEGERLSMHVAAWDASGKAVAVFRGFRLHRLP